MKCNYCVLALMCLAAIVSRSAAQSTDVQRARPGISNNGRFFGFVPKHEKILAERNVQVPAGEARTSDVQAATPRVSFAPSQVQQVGYSELKTTDSNLVGDVIGAAACQCPTPCGGGACPKLLLWGSGEYLHWWTSGMDLPALATTSSLGTIQDDAGVLPGASTLFGGNEIHDDGRSGGRFSVGMWLNSQRSSGLEFSFVYLSEDLVSFARSGADASILARPFFNVSLNQEDSRLIVFDGLVDGDLSIDSETDFHAYEIQLRRPASRSYGARSDWLFGFRRANLDDMLRISERTDSLSGPTNGTTFDLFDQFAVENEFQGGQIGINYIGPAVNCWSLELLAKVAIGYTSSQIHVSGQTTTTNDLGDTTTNSGGLLTQNSNIGSFDDDELGTLSEFGISMNRRFECGLSLNIGYTFLHWSDVARAGDQIDLQVNPTQIPPGTLSGEARPTLPFTRSDFWAQGISLGLEYRF